MPSKNQKVRITNTSISSTAIEDMENTVISGKWECSDNDFTCNYNKRPISKCEFDDKVVIS